MVVGYAIDVDETQTGKAAVLNVFVGWPILGDRHSVQESHIGLFQEATGQGFDGLGRIPMMTEPFGDREYHLAIGMRQLCFEACATPPDEVPASALDNRETQTEIAYGSVGRRSRDEKFVFRSRWTPPVGKDGAATCTTASQGRWNTAGRFIYPSRRDLR